MRYAITTKDDSTIVVDNVKQIVYNGELGTYELIGKFDEIVAVVPVSSLNYIYEMEADK